MQCPHCEKTFSRSNNLRRHLQNSCEDSANQLNSATCSSTFSQFANLKRHFCENNVPLKRQKLNATIVDKLAGNIQKLTSAFQNRISTYRFASDTTHLNITNFFEELKENVVRIITDYIEKYSTLKINFELFGLYVLPHKEISDIKSFNTKNKILTKSSDVSQEFEDFHREIFKKASEFAEKDSGWSLQQIMFLDVNINRYNPLSASSYIKLPKQIERKTAVLNIQNHDTACFAWSINAAFFPASGDPTLTTSYPHYSTLLNFEGIEFPMRMQDIPKFEEKNNISVNVFGIQSTYKNGKYIIEVVGPYFFTSHRQATHVNLLLLDDNGNNHYCLIKDLSRLVSRQRSNHNGKLYPCDGCLQFFTTLQKLQRHQENDCNHICTDIPTTQLIKNKYGESVPENILQFTNFEKQFPHPFVIYADFESLLKPIASCEPNNDSSFTINSYEHEPYSFAFYVKCSFDDRYSDFFNYRGPNAAEVFSKKLDETVLTIYKKHLQYPKKMLPLTQGQQLDFTNATICHICEKEFESTNIKVRDHSHETGVYRGAAHSLCNLNYKTPKNIPVFFHNLTNYDCHLFIQKLTMKEEAVNVLAQTKEKYITFSKSLLVEKPSTKIPAKFINIRFVDSFRFLPRSLDKLSETLESEQCFEIRKYFPTDTEFNLIRQKGIFPYNYVDTYEKLNETHLPQREQFFNMLTNESLSKEDYARACQVWNIFRCSTLGDYSDIYLQSDVLLLADIFENFRKVCLQKYKLDPTHYLTAPSLSWDAMLRFTQVKLELLTDIELVHFFKKGIRGGVSQCSKRKAVANNCFVPNHDPQKPTSYIQYLDATNLYGFAMNQPLPTGDFKWLSEGEIESFDCTAIADTSSKGYVLEVDLQYPKALHDAHNDLPFCPENIRPPRSKLSKLIPNLYDKSKYIIHYRNLQQCLKHGLKLKKLHRIVEFSQSPWLQPYIQLNTQLRNASKNEFEKDLFKLMVNSIFGKTMENVEKRKDIKLCTHWKNKTKSLGAETLISKPHFKSCSVFNENLVAIHLGKVQIYYDKPLYLGFSILDISKTVIYGFFYDYIKQKYGNDATLCYTDTDSLILEIFTDNIYKDMMENLELFDTSNYKVDNIHQMPVTASVVGKMKDEYAGVSIKRFYGTGAKAYCVEADEVMKKAKGVSKHVIKHNLQLSDYIKVVESNAVVYRKMYVFTSQLHTVYMQLKNKLALSSSDDKRHILPDKINTLAWGHVSLTSDPAIQNLDNLLELAYDLLQATPQEETFEETCDNTVVNFDLDLFK